MKLDTIDLDGPVHFADFGGVGRPFVLVHGLGGSHLNWLALAPLLTKLGRVLAIDLVGFGKTPPAGRSSSIDSNRRLVERFVDEVAGGRAVLVGNSMGGLISKLVAARAPRKVDALILVDPASPRPRGAPVDREIATRFLLYTLPWIGELFLKRQLAKLGPEGTTRERFTTCCRDVSRVDPAVFEAQVGLARERAEKMPWAHGAFLEAARSTVKTLLSKAAHDDALGRIAAPTLVIHGSRDRLIPLESSQALLRKRPDWTLEVIDDSGHIPQIEHPRETIEAIEKWLPAALAREAAAAARPAA